MKHAITSVIIAAVLSGCVGLTPVPAMSGKLRENVTVTSKEPTDAKDAEGGNLMSETTVEFDVRAPSGTDLEGAAVVTLTHGEWEMTVDRTGKGSTQGLADANVAIAPISAQTAEALAAQFAPLIQAAITGGFSLAIEVMKANAAAEASGGGGNSASMGDFLSLFGSVRAP